MWRTFYALFGVAWVAQFYAGWATNYMLCVKQFTLCLLLLEWHNFTLSALQIVRYVWNNFRPVCGCFSGTILRSLRYKLSAICGTIFVLFRVAWVANFTLAPLQIDCHMWNNLCFVWGSLSDTIVRLLRYKLYAMCGTIYALFEVAWVAQFYAFCAINVRYAQYY
jgi:hypothetical protein